MARVSMLHRSHKLKISEFNLLEARGWVIEMVIELEYRLNDMLIAYFNPDNTEEFYQVILNSSIIHTGGKLKALHSLGLISSKAMDKLRKLFVIRDAFAHVTVYPNGTLVLDETSGEKVMESIIDVITVMDSSGKMQQKEAKEYLEEFLSLLEETQTLLSKE